MYTRQDIRILYDMMQRALREFQGSKAYFSVKAGLEYPFVKNSEPDILLSWERVTQITLEKLEILLGAVDYGPDREDALNLVDQMHPPFKYKETEG